MEEGEVDIGAQNDETFANGQGAEAQEVNHPKVSPPMDAEIREAWRFAPPKPETVVLTTIAPLPGSRWSEGSARYQRRAVNKSWPPGATGIR